MMKRLWKSWDDYWFRPEPLFDLAVFRILATGGQLLIYLFVSRPLARDILAVSEIPHFYQPLAIVRFLLSAVGPEAVPTLLFVSAIFWITVIALLLGMIGLFTNVSLAVGTIGMVFIQAYLYSFGDFHHPEAIMAIALTVLALSPCGRVWSVDSIRRRAREALQQKRWTRVDVLEQTSVFARWPRLVLIWFFSLIYLSAAWYKYEAGGSGWLNGYTLQFYLLQDGLRWDVPLGVWLAGQHWIALLASWTCVLFEAGFFLALIFPRLLWILWPIGFGMHAGIFALMSAGFWEYMILYVALLPWTLISRWVTARDASVRHSPLEVLYDGECPLCLRSVCVMDGLDWLGRLRLLSFQEEAGARRAAEIGATPASLREQLHLITSDGQVLRGFFAFRRIARHLPLTIVAAPLLYLPGVTVVGPRLYRWIADGRRRFTSCDTGACRI